MYHLKILMLSENGSLNHVVSRLLLWWRCDMRHLESGEVWLHWGMRHSESGGMWETSMKYWKSKCGGHECCQTARMWWSVAQSIIENSLIEWIWCFHWAIHLILIIMKP